MSRRSQTAPSPGAWLFLWLMLLPLRRWFDRPHNAVFNPGTSAPLLISLWFNPDNLGGTRAILTKAGEYELLLESGKLLFRIATGDAPSSSSSASSFQSSGGEPVWDKSAEVSHSFSTSSWYHAQLWIEPGEEIGLSLNGGSPQTQSLSGGQSARVDNGRFYIGLPGDNPSSSSHWSSSYWSSSWSSWEMAALGASSWENPPFSGLVDEIAVFNESLDSAQRAELWNGGSGAFWSSMYEGWGPCGGWLALQGGPGASKKASAPPVTESLLALAESEPPERTLCQYVWGARPQHRDEPSRGSGGEMDGAAGGARRASERAERASQLVLRDRDSTGGVGGVLDERLYSLMDYFDPVAAVDREGEVVERYAWTAFGRREVMAPDWSAREGSEFDWSFGFHGQFLDEETGYYNYGFRYYVPWLGRWPNRDPIGEEGGVNLYGSSINDPVAYIDKLGLHVNVWRELQRPGDVPVYYFTGNIARRGSFTLFDRCGVRCRCGCSGPDPAWRASDCTVWVEAVIFVDLAEGGRDVGGVVGHEQAHVRSRLSRVHTLIREIEEHGETQRYSRKESCEEQTSDGYSHKLGMLLDPRVNPDHKGDKTATVFSPASGVRYPPQNFTVWDTLNNYISDVSHIPSARAECGEK